MNEISRRTYGTTTVCVVVDYISGTIIAAQFPERSCRYISTLDIYPAPNNNWTRRKERSACKPKNAKDEQFIPMRFLPFVERACASLRWPVALVQRGSEKRCR